MKNLKSVDEILDYAIKEEENAVRFYTELAEKARHSHLQKVFLEFADEEEAHKSKLQAAKNGMTFKPSEKEVLDLKISDYTADVSTDAIDTFEDALVVAMKKEKAAYKLYTRLAGMASEGDVRDLFIALAQEEAKHKLRFEIEYDNSMGDN
ncbi:rubrerythrin [Candidatus Fermentibacteria bacterium]|nr:MAG: rubrerythrin [Candidatus Fermentibacteria bacterium]